MRHLILGLCTFFDQRYREYAISNITTHREQRSGEDRNHTQPGRNDNHIHHNSTTFLSCYGLWDQTTQESFTISTLQTSGLALDL